MSTIVYLGAVGRSGTTLLERTLATSSQVVALGEVVHLWERSLKDVEPCGCGFKLGDCPFWSAVGRRAFGGWDQIDLAEINRDRCRVDRNRYIPWLLMPRLAPRGFRDAHRRHVDLLDRLYTAIVDVAREDLGADVVVDSSKHPSYLFLLRALPTHDVRLLHVIRDPRGVAHSWSRVVSRPESGQDMERLGSLRAAGRWTSHNLLFQAAGFTGTRRRRMSYEQFTSDPQQLGRVVDDLLATDQASTLQLDLVGSCVTLGTDHTVSGNPMRFRSGPVQIRSDQAWRDAMPRRARRLVGVLTGPLRWVYSR